MNLQWCFQASEKSIHILFHFLMFCVLSGKAAWKDSCGNINKQMKLRMGNNKTSYLLYSSPSNYYKNSFGQERCTIKQTKRCEKKYLLNF